MNPQVAFYAPMKPPHHPTPSGDRRMARLLIKALRKAGYCPQLASAFRSRNATGDPALQWRLETCATAEQTRLLSRCRSAPPAAWLTYHNYYKAPDLIGPWVSEALGIPYLLVEASLSPKQKQGPWRRGQSLAQKGMAGADVILQPNPGDLDGVAAGLDQGVRQVLLPPFLELDGMASLREDRLLHRAALASELDLDPSLSWLVTTAMMRPGAKTESYKVLAEALSALSDQRFALLVIGDGPTRSEVARGFEGLSHVRYLGVRQDIAPLHAACDLFVWPGIKEAFGLATLEAQAVGLPAILADRPGVRAMVQEGETAFLVPEGDAAAFSRAVARALSDLERLRQMGDAALRRVAMHHSLLAAAQRLRAELTGLGVRVPCGWR